MQKVVGSSPISRFPGSPRNCGGFLRLRSRARAPHRPRRRPRRCRTVGTSQASALSALKGEYKVKDAGLKPLWSEVRKALAELDRWSIRHVRREQNAEADRLVNAALDG